MTSSKPSKHHDVVIIGAGHNGIVAAKTYLQFNPSIDILIIDGGKSIGGVWSAERIYPGLIFEMPAPMTNFTDFDMTREVGAELWGDVTGDQVNEFLVSLLSTSKGSSNEVRTNMLGSTTYPNAVNSTPRRCE